MQMLKKNSKNTWQFSFVTLQLLFALFQIDISSYDPFLVHFGIAEEIKEI